jgi:hypothetical protein
MGLPNAEKLTEEVEAIMHDRAKMVEFVNGIGDVEKRLDKDALRRAQETYVREVLVYAMAIEETAERFGTRSAFFADAVSEALLTTFMLGRASSELEDEAALLSIKEDLSK